MFAGPPGGAEVTWNNQRLPYQILVIYQFYSFAYFFQLFWDFSHEFLQADISRFPWHFSHGPFAMCVVFYPQFF